jgi:hypothetical protein
VSHIALSFLHGLCWQRVMSSRWTERKETAMGNVSIQMKQIAIQEVCLELRHTCYENNKSALHQSCTTRKQLTSAKRDHKPSVWKQMAVVACTQIFVYCGSLSDAFTVMVPSCHFVVPASGTCSGATRHIVGTTAPKWTRHPKSMLLNHTPVGFPQLL